MKQFQIPGKSKYGEKTLLSRQIKKNFLKDIKTDYQKDDLIDQTSGAVNPDFRALLVKKV